MADSDGFESDNCCAVNLWDAALGRRGEARGEPYPGEPGIDVEEEAGLPAPEVRHAGDVHDERAGARRGPYPRCITITYAEMHLDVTPTVRSLWEPERTGIIFHSKPEKPLERRSYWANPYGFAEWFNERTLEEQPFGYFFEERSLQFDRFRLQVALHAEADPVPDQMPAYRKSRALVALQLIKRWRNLAYGRRHPTLRCPPSVLLAHYVALHANQTASLADELIHQVELVIAILEAADRGGRRVHAVNERCPRDVLTDRWPESGADQKIFLTELRQLLDQLLILRRGVSLQRAFEILEELFGERPTRGAFEQAYG